MKRYVILNFGSKWSEVYLSHVSRDGNVLRVFERRVQETKLPNKYACFLITNLYTVSRSGMTVIWTAA
jgi:hypothetical protein